jgi:hypothetical protein
MQASQQLNKKWRVFSRASSRQRFTGAAVCLAVIAFFGLFWFVGHYKIDMGWWFGYCGFKQRYDLPCPTCGMTTAVLAFAQGKIFEAFYIQPAAGLFCCVLVVAAFMALLVAVFGVRFGFLERFFRRVKIIYIIAALLIIIAAGWAVTLARAMAGGN